MNSFIPATPCPCESGFEYRLCCGNPEIESISIVSNINAAGQSDTDLTPELKQGLKEFALSPEIFPLNINFQSERCTCVKMSPFWFSESIFLDSTRINGTCALECDLQWLADSSDEIEYQYSAFIFHTAFCGSTLISRALELIYDSLPLREPDLLYALLDLEQIKHASPEFKSQWYSRILKILSRRFETSQPVVIKANDYANSVIESILEFNSVIPVLLVFTPFSEFLAGCLRAESRHQWIFERYQLILPNLQQIFPNIKLPEISDKDFAKMAATLWSYNIKLFINACNRFPTQIKTLNFNTFLDSPHETITACADWFKLHQRDDINPDAEMSWSLNVYSKNPDITYSPQKRQSDIADCLMKYSAEMIEADSLVSDMLGDFYPFTDLPCKLR